MFRRRLSSWIVLSASVFLVFVAGQVHAQAVTQGYSVGAPVQTGMIVELKSGSSSSIEPDTKADASKMFGVVVNPSATPITLTQTNLTGQVFVATSGLASVLVSNEGGVIQKGDYITISALDGIGQKASSGDSVVLGKAATPFLGSTDSMGTTSLKESSGQTINVHIGVVSVSLGIAHNPIYRGPPNGDVPGFLQSAGDTIANKTVSAVRLYIAFFVILISIVVAGSLLYAGVRNSFVAIGRNPLSKKFINRNLAQVVLISVLVFIIGLFAVYLLLRL